MKQNTQHVGEEFSRSDEENEITEQYGRFDDALIQLKRLSKSKNLWEMVDDYERQKEKYDLWRKNGSQLKNIYFSQNNYEPKRFCHHSIPFADEYKLKKIPVNSLLQFWHCDENGDIEFLLYEYIVEDCPYKAEVEQITEDFSIGINVLSEERDKFRVVIHNGAADEVRKNVRQQLRNDIEIFHQDENPLVKTAFTYLGVSLALSLQAWLSQLLRRPLISGLVAFVIPLLILAGALPGVKYLRADPSDLDVQVVVIDDNNRIPPENTESVVPPASGGPAVSIVSKPENEITKSDPRKTAGDKPRKPEGSKIGGICNDTHLLPLKFETELQATKTPDPVRDEPGETEPYIKLHHDNEEEKNASPFEERSCGN